MTTTVPANTIILAIVLLAIGIALVAWLMGQRQRSMRLKRRFGAEYDLAVVRLGSRKKAEAELLARQNRVSAFKIVPLQTADSARFSEAWNALQGRFVDNPKGVVAEADQLVRELMVKRGYPMGNFERLAADISVDHPSVVANFRAAETIATRDARGQADTEDLRKAVVHYRALFDELLGVAPDKVRAVPAEHRVVVQS